MEKKFELYFRIDFHGQCYLMKALKPIGVFVVAFM